MEIQLCVFAEGIIEKGSDRSMIIIRWYYHDTVVDDDDDSNSVILLALARSKQHLHQCMLIRYDTI